MSEEKKCLRCGGSHLEPGWAQSTGKIYFRPTNTKFLMLKSADVEVNANMCMDCGSLELVGDVEKAKSLVKRKQPH